MNSRLADQFLSKNLAVSSRLDRRTFLAGLGGTAFAIPAFAKAATPRVAALDWALLENLLVLNVVPVAAAELTMFRQLAVEPVVPDTVADLGLRRSINMELLYSLSPDLIYLSPFNSQSQGLLSRIAPTRTFSLFESNVRPLPKMEAAILAMGAELGRNELAQDYVTRTQSELAVLRHKLSAAASRPVFLVDMANARAVRAYREDSLFGNAMELLGFENAFGVDTAYPAFSPIGIEAMAERPDAMIVVVGPVTPNIQQALSQSVLWNALPAVKARRVFQLDAANAFGSLPAIRRFAGLFANALLAENTLL
ncbi:ABC transporter substrate-binding protein [Aureimonas fodinaquatilis]|uniref:ABC transporter substrate-binding protein n=1 Tax=Aureimonas fodinaquatilis TaxID=2565783 RepID=UPI00165EBB1B|nr:ABC transporter substrate-binding protein [Aureimonas fodinaquatilis]